MGGPRGRRPPLKNALPGVFRGPADRDFSGSRGRRNAGARSGRKPGSRGKKGPLQAPLMCTIGRTGAEFAGPCWVRGAKGFAAPFMCTIGRTGAEFAPELQSFAAPFSPAGPGPESPWAAMIRFGHWNVRPRIGESLVGLGGGGVKTCFPGDGSAAAKSPNCWEAAKRSTFDTESGPGMGPGTLPKANGGQY